MNTTSGLVSKQIVFFTHILLDILNKHNKQKACENLWARLLLLSACLTLALLKLSLLLAGSALFCIMQRGLILM